MPKKPSTDLVQIQKSPIPPLRQSTQETMACPKFYTEVFIKGRKLPGGLEAARGTEIHKTMAAYLSHCARKQVGMDLDAFENFSRGAGPQAYKILSGLRDGFVVDFEHLLATELPMALDENFQPTDVSESLGGVSIDTGLDPHYQGTLDGVYVFRPENRILIDDFKSHARPFDPADKPQGKEYSTFIFKHFPWVQQVDFRLVFVRYRSLTRMVSYTREDLPRLMEELKAARERQKVLHENFDTGKEIQAIGNDGCFYCPLLSDRECPILRDNPNAQGEPSEWVSSSLVYSAYAKVNNARMKAWVQANGKNIILRDYNQKCYSYGPTESESKVYPLFEATAGGILVDKEGSPVMPIVSLLLDKTLVPLDDREWLNKLVISSTKIESPLKAKKRVLAHQVIQDKAEKVTKVRMKVSKPLDSIPDEELEEDDEGGWDEDEF